MHPNEYYITEVIFSMAVDFECKDLFMPHFLGHSQLKSGHILSSLYELLMQSQLTQNENLLDILARKVSYPVWSLFVVRYC